MSQRGKPKSPYFVSAEVRVLTDEGDEYHLEMHRASSDGWPVLSRRVRWRDQFDYGARKSIKIGRTAKTRGPTETGLYTVGQEYAYP